MDLKTLQQKIKDFVNKNNLDSPTEFRVLDLVSETGEVAKEILKMTNYGNAELKINDEVKLELGDTLYSLIVVANKLDVNLDEALNLVLQKYEKRLSKGSAGSESDKK